MPGNLGKNATKTLREKLTGLDDDKPDQDVDDATKKQNKPDPAQKPDDVDGGKKKPDQVDPKDDKLSEVKNYIVDFDKISITKLKEHFGLKPKEAKELMQQLQNDGAVGPPNGNQPRIVNTGRSDRAMKDYIEKEEAKNKKELTSEDAMKHYLKEEGVYEEEKPKFESKGDPMETLRKGHEEKGEEKEAESSDPEKLEQDPEKLKPKMEGWSDNAKKVYAETEKRINGDAIVVSESWLRTEGLSKSETTGLVNSFIERGMVEPGDEKGRHRVIPENERKVGRIEEGPEDKVEKLKQRMEESWYGVVAAQKKFLESKNSYGMAKKSINFLKVKLGGGTEAGKEFKKSQEELEAAKTEFRKKFGKCGQFFVDQKRAELKEGEERRKEKLDEKTKEFVLTEKIFKTTEKDKDGNEVGRTLGEEYEAKISELRDMRVEKMDSKSKKIYTACRDWYRARPKYQQIAIGIGFASLAGMGVGLGVGLITGAGAASLGAAGGKGLSMLKRGVTRNISGLAKVTALASGAASGGMDILVQAGQKKLNEWRGKTDEDYEKKSKEDEKVKFEEKIQEEGIDKVVKGLLLGIDKRKAVLDERDKHRKGQMRNRMIADGLAAASAGYVTSRFTGGAMPTIEEFRDNITSFVTGEEGTGKPSVRIEDAPESRIPTGEPSVKIDNLPEEPPVKNEQGTGAEKSPEAEVGEKGDIWKEMESKSPEIQKMFFELKTFDSFRDFVEEKHGKFDPYKPAIVSQWYEYKAVAPDEIKADRSFQRFDREMHARSFNSVTFRLDKFEKEYEARFVSGPELAKKMGMEFDPFAKDVQPKFESKVLTELNGRKIPLDLLSEEDRQKVLLNREAGRMMAGGKIPEKYMDDPLTDRILRSEPMTSSGDEIAGKSGATQGKETPGMGKNENVPFDADKEDRLLRKEQGAAPEKQVSHYDANETVSAEKDLQERSRNALTESEREARGYFEKPDENELTPTEREARGYFEDTFEGELKRGDSVWTVMKNNEFSDREIMNKVTAFNKDMGERLMSEHNMTKEQAIAYVNGRFGHMDIDEKFAIDAKGSLVINNFINDDKLDQFNKGEWKIPGLEETDATAGEVPGGNPAESVLSEAKKLENTGVNLEGLGIEPDSKVWQAAQAMTAKELLHAVPDDGASPSSAWRSSQKMLELPEEARKILGSVSYEEFSQLKKLSTVVGGNLLSEADLNRTVSELMAREDLIQSIKVTSDVTSEQVPISVEQTPDGEAPASDIFKRDLFDGLNKSDNVEISPKEFEEVNKMSLKKVFDTVREENSGVSNEGKKFLSQMLATNRPKPGESFGQFVERYYDNQNVGAAKEEQYALLGEVYEEMSGTEAGENAAGAYEKGAG